MASINLSQGTAREKGGESFFDKGFAFSVVLLVLVLGVFGGLRWYLGTLEAKGTALDQQIAEKSTLLKGERIDRLADIDKRITFLEKAGAASVPLEVFVAVESAIIPQVRLTELEYNGESGELSFSATTDGFKSLAQQLQTLKAKPEFDSVEAGSINRREEGGIAFEVTVSYSPKQNQ